MFYLSSEQAAILQATVNSKPLIERPLNARVASANHLARRVVYELDLYFTPKQEQQVVYVFDDDAEVRQYAIQFIYTNHLGIVPYLLTPLDVNNPRMHLVFRGSKDAPAWCRSTETPAPGYASFYQERDLLISELHNALEYNDVNHLTISGHSLGGSDAQTCAAEVMHAIMEMHQDLEKASKYNFLTKIKKLTINHVNSAGIANSVAETSSIAAAYVSKYRLLDINVMCVLTAGDAVQQTGQSHILSNVESNIAMVELVKLSSEFEGVFNKKYLAAAAMTLPVTYTIATGYAIVTLYAAYNAHKLRFCETKDFKEQVYRFYNNTTESGREKISSKLSKHPLDNSVAGKVIYMFHMLQERFTRTQRIRAQEAFVWVDKEESEPPVATPSVSETGLIIIHPTPAPKIIEPIEANRCAIS